MKTNCPKCKSEVRGLSENDVRNNLRSHLSDQHDVSSFEELKRLVEKAKIRN